MENEFVSKGQIAHEFDFVKKYVMVNSAEFDILEIEKRIMRLPCADVYLLKHGYWINHFDDLYPEESCVECSVCHEETNGLLINENYCPNCGAKMDAEVCE